MSQPTLQEPPSLEWVLSTASPSAYETQVLQSVDQAEGMVPRLLPCLPKDDNVVNVYENVCHWLQSLGKHPVSAEKAQRQACELVVTLSDTEAENLSVGCMMDS